MKTTIALVAALTCAASAFAQTDRYALRPYGLITYEAFSARQTFEAAFGQSAQPFWGAGAELILPHQFFIDVSASRFKKTGERAFISGGQVVKLLGIAETVTLTPFEVSGGYRFRLRRRPNLVPYVGAGIGWYSYKQTSDFSVPGEDVDTQHVGALLVGGAEFRVHRWIRLSIDGQYTHIPGILGIDPKALSTAAGETDLGGAAARFRFIVGR